MFDLVSLGLGFSFQLEVVVLSKRGFPAQCLAFMFEHSMCMVEARSEKYRLQTEGVKEGLLLMGIRYINTIPCNSVSPDQHQVSAGFNACQFIHVGSSLHPGPFFRNPGECVMNMTLKETLL